MFTNMTEQEIEDKLVGLRLKKAAILNDIITLEQLLQQKRSKNVGWSTRRLITDPGVSFEGLLD